MTFEEFYDPYYAGMQESLKEIEDMIRGYEKQVGQGDIRPVMYLSSRIKQPDSMLSKLKKQGLSQTLDAALHDVFDTVGLRVICSFVSDVYDLVSWLHSRNEIEIIKEKDYYAHPKPNGYRSYHVIVKLQEGAGAGFYAEIQIRTIAVDCWAALEHQIKYKKELPNEQMIRAELKRCADEIASTDLSMQTIRDIISVSEKNELVHSASGEWRS